MFTVDENRKKCLNQLCLKASEKTVDKESTRNGELKRRLT